MSDIIVPKVGLTIEEVEVVEWLVDVGDTVDAGQPIATVNADKTEVEIEAPTTGTIGSIEADTGAVVPVGGLLGRLGSPDGAQPEGVGETEQSAAASPAPPQATEEVRAVASSPAPLPVPQPARTEDHVARIRVSPWARTLATRHQVPLATLTGSGPSGRIVGRDVLGAARDGVPSTRPRHAAAELIALRAEVDVAEALGVISYAQRFGIATSIGDLVARATFDALAQHQLVAEPVRAFALTHSATLEPARRVAPTDLAELASIVRARETGGLVAAGECQVMMIDLSDSGVELVSAVVPAGTSMTLAIGPIEWSARLRHGATVDRPRIRLTMTLDPALAEAAEAGATLRTIAYQLARAGDALAQLPIAM
ncbi:MAG: biotin/lipoyl-containing protein [Actinomycetota bacterium]